MSGTLYSRINERVFIIAEAGVNHNGDINLGREIIDAAYESGADAVKFQTFIADRLVSKNTEMAKYQRENLKKGFSQYEMLKSLELGFEDFMELKQYCDGKGILFLSSPFDLESIDFLYELVPYYKIPSGEITNSIYLKKIAEKGKPVIISTGMCYLGDIEKATMTIREINPDIEMVLLHCTTNYPTPFTEVNLKAMVTLKEAFKLPVGYSDHTEGIEIPLAAVALGARIIEKHFTVDKNLPGPDHKASLEPCEFREMVRCIRNVEKALGDGVKKPTESEKAIMNVVRKRIVAAKDLEAGSVIRGEDIILKRTSQNAISCEFLDVIIGCRLVKSVREDEPLTWAHFMNRG